MRQAVVQQAAECITKAKGKELREMRMHVANEMRDDPQWNSDVPFDWARYLERSKQRRTFATFFLIQQFVELQGISVIVYKD